MAIKKTKSRSTGVRFKEHPTRKHQGKPDRYYTIRYKVGGKLYEEGLGWATEGWNDEKARDIRADLMQAKKTGEGAATLSEKRQISKTRKEEEKAAFEQAKKDFVSFASFFDSVYFPASSAHKTKGTNQRELSILNFWLKPAIGAMPLKEITADHLEALRQAMTRADRTPRSIQYTLAIVRQVYSEAKRTGHFTGPSPTEKMRKTKLGDNKRVRFITKEEEKILFDELQRRSTTIYRIAFFSLYTGARAGEVFALKWGDIDFANEIVRFRDTKNKESRSVHLTSGVLSLLKEIGIGKASERVFNKRGGGQIETVSRAFERAVAATGLNDGVDDSRDKLVFHTLRHTFASRLVQAGVSLYVVKEMMGHKTLAMTERYAHLDEATFKAAIKKMEG